KADEGQRLSCFADQVNHPPFKSLIGCVAGGQPTPDNLLNCSIDKGLKEQTEQARQCISSAGSSDKALLCISKNLSEAHRDAAECISRTGVTAEAIKCLDRVSPEMAKARAVVACLSTGDTTRDGETAACLGRQVGGDPARIAGCLDKGDRTAV